MSGYLTWLFSGPGFMPHGHCYLWQPGTLWLNVGSDGLIAAAYFAIPFSLYSLVRRRFSELPFAALILMFAAFILLCGSTHLMEIWTVWNPNYRLGGALKLLTGIVSIATTVALFRLTPLAMQLKSPRELRNEVELRTAELAETNEALRRTVAQLERQSHELEHTYRQRNESLALLETTLRSVGDAVISTDATGLVQFMNSVAERLTGWREDEARTRPLADVFHIVNEQTREPVESPVSKVLRAGTTIGLANHTVLIARDKSERPIEDSGAPILEGSEIRGVVLVFRDVTAERASRGALLNSQQRYRAVADQFTNLADNVDQLIWMAEADGSIFWYNKRWYDYTGTTLEATQGWGWQDFHDSSELPAVLERWRGSIASGDPLDTVFSLKGADGKLRPFLTRVVPIKDDNGNVIRWFGTLTDISDRQRAESLLREASARKDVFLATLSHELRNPLAPIRNAASLLAKSTLTSADLERSRLIIARQVGHMASLLDDLLDASRITRGVFALKKNVVDLQGLLAEAVETARPLIETKRHILKLDWPAAPLDVEVDPIRLVQIASNLLTNAAKYTDPEGMIFFTVTAKGNEFAMSVRDTGIGLAPEMLTKVFEMFCQVAPENGRAEGGLGIGLALVKGLVDLHGGHVEARSAGLECGTEFIVTLPGLRIAAEVTSTDRNAAGGVSSASGCKRVLIADDNEDGAFSLGMLMEASGHEIHLAHTGPDALHLAGKIRPNACILDIGMPGMDGYEVARRLRSETWGGQMLLIALTGWGQEEDKRRAVEAGFDHHLTKPVDPVVLETLLSRFRTPAE